MVTDNFSKSGLDLNGKVSLSQPTALEWGPDGRLYVTEVEGNVKVLSVAFGDPNPDDEAHVNTFYVTDAETLGLVKNIPNYNDDGSVASGNARQVTGISVVQQYDAEGNPVTIFGKPAVSIYVTSSDSRIGGAADGDDTGLDTNSGTITRLDQTETGWTATDLVRGLARSEENHALNGLEVVQEVDAQGTLVSERLIVANGGNANSGAPSNNFAGQQETAYSGAILEIDLDQLKTLPVLTDPNSGRQYVYDIPTLDDPTRAGADDANDPFGGNDGLNGGKIDPTGPVQIYSAGYRNPYDVEVTEDGRVWTYDNGSNNSWGGRPIGEAGDNGANVDYAQWLGYIATNLNNGDINTGDPINLESWDPKNYDQFHEITRSDDLEGRERSAGQGGVTTYEWVDPDSGATLTLVYGGHPNPTRASGGQSGILYTPKDGVDNAFLMVSDVDKDGPGSSDYDAVIAWLSEVENQYASVAAGDLTSRVIAVTPGELYYITVAGNAYRTSDYSGSPTTINGETVLGASGLPSDFDEVVANINPVEGNYLEGGYTDGAVDAGKGSVNGLAEYTSTILDDPENGIKMSGAILAASLNQGSLTVMGRDADGVVQTTSGTQGQTLAEDRSTIAVSGAPLGLAAIGDDLSPFDGQTAFQGSVWTTVFKQNGPLIEILQPNNGAVPLAGSEIVDSTDYDGDGVDHFNDPFEFSADNGFGLDVNQRLLLDFSSETSGYSGTIFDTGLMGAALDGETPNRDARTADEGFTADKQQDGLYDLGGNIIPGGNAPIFQIKKVAGGTVVGSDNTARDAMHVGIKPGPDVERLVVTSKIKNWVPSVAGGIKAGQLTGVMLGDGTQANYLRLMFGAMMIDGTLAAGFEVGYEVDDDYTVLNRVAVPALSGSDVANLDLMLEVDIGNGFAVSAGYLLDDGSAPVSLDLGGFTLPPGVLQDVLTGAHTISDGDTTLPSGAAVGFLAETSPTDAASENGLSAIDFLNLQIEALGNEILATTAAEVGAEGTDGLDTILYTGIDTDLAPLAGNVENFDGSGSSADFTVTGNSADNVMIAGPGTNTFMGGGGADSIHGTLDNIDGSLITDFMPDDEFLILGSFLNPDNVSYSRNAGVVTLTFTDPQTGSSAVVNLSGSQFDGFDPVNGPSTFHVMPTEFGTRVTYDIETVIYRINTGGGTVSATDGGLDWQGDAGSGLLSGHTSDTYIDNLSNEESEIDLSNLIENGNGTVPWQVFVSERSDNDAAAPRIEYAFPVTAGETYSITLYYTENWPGIFNEDDRIFDVSVEGSAPAEFSNINPLQEAIDLYGADAGQQALLGVGLSRTYTLTAQDDTLNLSFLHDSQNPKINAIEVRQFGFGVTPPDRSAPEVQLIWVEEPTDNDSPILATVVISDDIGIDLASIDGDELVFTGFQPGSVGLAPGDDAITVSDDGKTVTVKYQLTPPADTNAWSSGDYTVGVAAGSYTDTSGNGVAAFEASFDIAPPSNVLFSLAFEANGEPLDEGGFDGVLGGIQDTSATTAIQGGDLVVNTSDGDIAKGQSANDFIRYVDLSDPSLNEIVISTRFDNPFPSALAAQGLPAGTIPNYAQQGIVFGLGTQGQNELVKLVLGGNKGNVIQIWSNPNGTGIDTTYTLSDLLVDDSQGLNDVVSLQLSLAIDKAAGTVSPIVTFFGAGGAVLGGLRAEPTPGFVTATAETLPSAVLDNLLDSAAQTAVGVTSNDYRTLGSYEARWEYLDVTTPDALEEPATPIAIANAPTLTESGDSGVTTLAFAVTTDASVNATLELVYSIDGGATTQTRMLTFTDGAATLTLDVANDDVDNGPETLSVQLVDVNDEAYAIDANADTATGTVVEDDQPPLIAIASAPTVAENGDTGVTTLTFVVTTDADVNASLELVYSLDGGATTQTRLLSFTDGTANLTIDVANDDVDNGPETLSVQLVDVNDPNYAIDPQKDTATGTVMEDDQATLIAIANAPTQVESGDSGVTTLAFAVTTDAGVNASLELTFSLDGGATTQSRVLAFTNGAATLDVDVANDDIDNGTETLLVQLLGVDNGEYAIDPAADTATGSITEDDQVPLIAIADALTVQESGDSGTTTLAFALSVSTSVTADVTLSFSTDGGATTQTQVVSFVDGAGTLSLDVPNDDIDNGAETLAVQLVGVDDSGYAIDTTADTASGRVTEDDATTGVLLDLDFELAGDPLVEGGFDGLLGGIEDSGVSTSVEGGDLVVYTSNGDISQGQSANDFIKYVDLSDAALNEINIASRFANPFPAALAAQGLAGGTVPNYAQQGIVFGLGTQGQNEVVKLVFGGNKGNAVQIWSNPDGDGIDTLYKLSDLLADSSLGLNDVADIEMTLAIDKAAGTVTPIVTFFGAGGAVLGGLRAEPTAGFVTATAETLPSAVLDNLLDPAAATAVGVTSNDNKTLSSYEARWESLTVTTPDAPSEPGDPATLIALGDAPAQVESGDSGATTLAFAVTTDAGVNATLELVYSTDGGATTQTQAVAFADGAGTLAIDVPNDAIDNGPDAITVQLIDVNASDYAVDPNADTASGSVSEDDATKLIAIADALTVQESGDSGTTTLAFALSVSTSVTADVTLSFSTDGGATTQTQVVSFTDGAGTLSLDVPNDDIDNGAETLTVQLVGVDDSGYAIDTTADTASGSVSEDDATTGVLLDLDFELAGDPLVEGGFDGLLGGIEDSGVSTSVQGGDLVVYTSNGDISQGQSANDFIKYVDLSDAALNEINIASRFANPFPAALAAQGLAGGTVPNYAQQGIVFGLGTQGQNEVVKLVFGGNKGNAVQIWSNPDGDGIDTLYKLSDLLADSSLGLNDVADIEMTLAIDKAAGTVTPIVTFFGAGGAVLGGLRAEPTAGFVTATAETLPSAVLDNLLDPAAATAVGVTSNDNKTLSSYEARWESLTVTTPDAPSEPGDPATLIALGDAPAQVESGDSGATTLAFAVTTDAGVNATLELVYSTDGGATTQTQAVAFADGAGTLAIDVPNDAIDNGPDAITVQLIDVNASDYAVDPNADTASGSVSEDDATKLIAIADALTVQESGDSGTTTLAFALSVSTSVTADVTLSFSTDGGATTQTQVVSFTDGAGTLSLDVPNDDIDNGAETLTVQLVGVDDSGYAIDTTADTASGSVSEDDATTGVLLDLDFELAGDPLVEGGFDGLLGGIEDSGVSTSVQGGDLVVYTSNGDISQGQSANDFIKYVDLSDAALNEINIASRFANPFPAALAAQGLAGGTVPNYAQQGIVFGLGTQGQNEVVKLVFGGNKGNAVQIWSNPDGDGIDTLYKLSDLLADSSLGLNDVADIEMTLAIDKAAGTVTPIVTFFGAGGAVLGGLRAEPTAGFVTATAETLPSAVLDNLLDPAAATAVGVTSNDNKTLTSYEARWESLTVTTPDAPSEPGDPATLIALGDAPAQVESGDSGATTLAFAVTTDAGVNATLELVYSTDGGATTQTQAVAFAGGAGTLAIDVPNDAIDNGPDAITVQLIDVNASDYAVDPNADTASGSVSEDDATSPSQAEQVFAGADLETSETYDDTAVGSASVTITPNEDVQHSNYGSNSFQVANTGDKKIAAVYFDVRGALYGDSVFDPDGKGGDTTFKTWRIDSNGATGALQPSGYEHYFLPGVDPDPSDSSNNGGFRGALVKFSATTDGGFTQGEVVGFSGDMDPNSIAGLDKEGASGVDTGSIPDWDVGGVSGAELIGSRVYIKFTDGSTASAQLMGDGSQSGAQARVTEAPQDLAATLSVNGTAPGEVGSYGGEVPTVVVSGPAGAWVRVIMTKGHQPVANTTDDVQATVEGRLAGKDFAVNNAAEFQFVDVQLDSEGTADISDQFVYDRFLNGTASFAGDDTLPLGFVAAVIDDPSTTSAGALGPVTEPIYLSSNGMPVSPPAVIGESGVVSVTQANSDSWTGVSFAEPLDDPSVVMGPLTDNDGEPVTVRVRNVTETGFEFQVDEWNYLDGAHEQESISWLAINSGVHTLENGLTVAAGSGQASGEAQTVSFGTVFDTPPVVLAQAVSDNQATALTHRIDAVDGNGFGLHLQDEEGEAIDLASESVGWIAIAEGGGSADGLLVGRTGDQVTDTPFEILFDGSFDDVAFLADMQTYDGSDPATVRASSIGPMGVTIFLEEEQSADDEVVHTSEDVGFVGLEAGPLMGSDGLT